MRKKRSSMPREMGGWIDPSRMIRHPLVVTGAMLAFGAAFRDVRARMEILACRLRVMQSIGRVLFQLEPGYVLPSHRLQLAD
jgi:hypothetical protein